MGPHPDIADRRVCNRQHDPVVHPTQDFYCAVKW